MSLDAARRVADAVLYEGYLLYPYRASAAKNRSRWQFGVLGPPGARPAAYAEPAGMSMECLLSAVGPGAAVTVHLRFLQLQAREVRDRSGRPVDRLTVAGEPVLSWAEAVEHEIVLGPVALAARAGFPAAGPVRGGGRPPAGSVGAEGSAVAGSVDFAVAGAAGSTDFAVSVPGGADEEPLGDAGRLVRRRWPLTARVRTAVEADGDLMRLTVRVLNEHPEPVTTKEEAVRSSLLGTHLLIEARDARFVSVQDPPPDAAAAARRCRPDRCWPVLAGSDDVLLGAPIILYDHPEVAGESPGELFDCTEIDEILTLRVMTMTEAEKAEARATDPRARTIVDRCDAMSPAALRRLHGARRPVPGSAAAPPTGPAPDPASAVASGAAPTAVSIPGAPDAEFPEVASGFGGSEVVVLPADSSAPASAADGPEPWWDPAVDGAVDPASDSVLVGGVPIGRGSLVRLRPSRRADAQDLFFADQIARVTAVVSDVDDATHVAVVLVDDPAADLHDWYGRYFYFAPDELEPLDTRGKPC